MMNYDEFRVKVVYEMEQRVGKGKVIIQDVIKNNHLKLYGLVIQESNTNAFPIIYLEKYYGELKNKTFPDVIDEIWEFYLCSKIKGMMDMSFLCNWNMAKERVVEKVVNYNQNLELLQMIPHRKYLNLAITYCHIVDVRENGVATIPVTNDHLDMWEIYEEELQKVAHDNYKKFYSVKTESVYERLKKLLGNVPRVVEQRLKNSDRPMHVITNQINVDGATVMLYPEEFRGLADKWMSDLYILPASIHELIVVPAIGNDVYDLKEMVCNANSACNRQKDYLSDSVYCYSRKRGEIYIVLE